MSFFKAFFSSCLGAFVALISFAILGIIILAAMGTEVPVEVKSNSVLNLKLDYPISELEVEDPIAKLMPELAEQTMGLIQLKQAIAHAKSDENIKGIYLTSGFVGAGVSSTKEIREALEDFKKSGKWVIAYSNYFSEKGYYLASVSDSIFLNPEGFVELNGLSTQVMFYKKMFDKLEIRPQVFRVGEYKGAVEPFLRDNLSDENRLQLNSLLNSIYNTMLGQISDGRKIAAEKIKDISGKMLVRNAKQAREYSLVDALFYEDEALDYMKKRLGIEKGKKINLISYSDYKHSYMEESESKNEIAVIVADGEIIDGKSGKNTVGSTTIIEALRKARKSKRVKAVVLRINSPGGSAQASDEMWREVMLIAKEKTVIASMSDYAASGGYYIAMACDTIVAEPTTVTGSIGVFMFIPDVSQFMANKLGITFEQVKTGEIGELLTITRGLNETEKSILQQQADKVYESFTSKAAAGRKMSQDEIKKIASGRVWTGEQAKENGLVDELGGFNEAVEIAAKNAGVSGDFYLRYYPKPKTFLENYLSIDEEEATERKMREILGAENALLLQQWKKVQQMKGVQARMPVEFTID